VIALTDENAAVKTQYIYSPFGETAVIGEATMKKTLRITLLTLAVLALIYLAFILYIFCGVDTLGDNLGI
jgi:hypothetical protein